MDNDPDLTLFLFLFFLSVGSFVYGFLIRIGKFKSWWLLYSTPIVPEATAYLGMPFSIIVLLLSLTVLLPDIDDRGIVLDFLCLPLVIAFVLAAWRPRWLAPSWLLWLEDHHDDLLPLLKSEAQQMGGRTWSARVSTQEGLEEWVAEVQRKYGRL